MKVLLFLMLLIGPAQAQQMSSLDVLPDTNSSDSTAILNNTLRQNQNAINTIGGYFGNNGTLNPNSGGTGATTLTGILQGNGTNAFTAISLPADSTKFLNGVGSFSTPNYPVSPIGYNLVSITNFSNATTTGNISIDSTKQYFVRIVITAQSTNTTPEIRFNSDTNSDYSYIYRGFNSSATAVNGNGTAQSGILVGSFQTSSDGDSYIDFNIGFQGTGGVKSVIIYGKTASVLLNNVNPGFTDFMGSWQATTTATVFNLTSPGGSITFSGNVYLYELKTS